MDETHVTKIIESRGVTKNIATCAFLTSETLTSRKYPFHMHPHLLISPVFLSSTYLSCLNHSLKCVESLSTYDALKACFATPSSWQSTLSCACLYFSLFSLSLTGFIIAHYPTPHACICMPSTSSFSLSHVLTIHGPVSHTSTTLACHTLTTHMP